MLYRTIVVEEVDVPQPPLEPSGRSGPTGRLAVRLLITGALVTVSIAAAAATPSQLIDRGISLREAGKDADALAAFRQAYEQEPSARAAAQVGLALQAVGSWVEAERFVTEALGHEDDPWIRKHRRPLSQALGRISAQLGDLQVIGAPPGAEVRFGGRVIGTLPMTTAARVVAQRALLEVAAPDHAAVAREVTVPAGGRSLERVTLVAGTADATVDPFEEARRDALKKERGDDGASAPARRLRVVVRLSAGLMVAGSTLAEVEVGKHDYTAQVFSSEDPGPHLRLSGGVRAPLADDLDLLAELGVGYFAGPGDDHSGFDASVSMLTVEAEVALALRPLGAASAWYVAFSLPLGVDTITGSVTDIATQAEGSVSDTTFFVGLGVGTGILLGADEEWDVGLCVPVRFTVGDEGGVGDAVTASLALRAAYAF